METRNRYQTERRKVRPFADPGFVPVNNLVLDLVLPRLSSNAVKVLLVIMRATVGWRKTSDRLSYSQIKLKTGIGSNATVSRALGELRRKGCVLRTDAPGGGFEYALNTELEIEVRNAARSRDSFRN